MAFYERISGSRAKHRDAFAHSAMSDSSFQVDGVDRVELFVRDWDEAAAWYERVLGLTPESAYEKWWTSGDGPLVLSTGDGATMLALFEREPRPEASR
jgi:catechol-2,3-dioxygenase